MPLTDKLLIGIKPKEIKKELKLLKKEEYNLKREERWYMQIFNDLENIKNLLKKLRDKKVELLTEDNRGVIRRRLRRIARHIRRFFRWYKRVVKVKNSLGLKLKNEDELKVYASSLVRSLARTGDLWNKLKNKEIKIRPIKIEDLEQDISQLEIIVREAVRRTREWEDIINKILEESERRLEKEIIFEKEIKQLVKEFKKEIEDEERRGSVEGVDSTFAKVLEELEEELEKAKRDNDKFRIEHINKVLEDIKKELEVLRKEKGFPREDYMKIKEEIKALKD